MVNPNPNFDVREVAVTTLKNRRKEFADNVTNHVPLLDFLNSRGQVQIESGGEVLMEEIDFAENGTFKFYQGFETLDTSETQVFTAAEFDWKQAACTVVIDGRTQRQNSGPERTINLLSARITNCERTFANQIASSMYSDGTGSGGKEIGGLQLLIADDPTTGTIGGINSATNAFWRNISLKQSDFGGGANSATNILDRMNTTWRSVVRNRDVPTWITADPTQFDFFWSALQAIQRITTPREGASGFQSLEFNGPGGNAPVVHDPNAPANNMYFINTDFIFWRVHRDANFEPLANRDSFNQDAMSIPMILMANMTISNRSLQAVLRDVA